MGLFPIGGFCWTHCAYIALRRVWPARGLRREEESELEVWHTPGQGAALERGDGMWSLGSTGRACLQALAPARAAPTMPASFFPSAGATLAWVRM